MISIVQCHGCVHLRFDYRTGWSSSAQDPCMGCFVTSGGTPSNYRPVRYTATAIPEASGEKAQEGREGEKKT